MPHFSDIIPDVGAESRAETLPGESWQSLTSRSFTGGLVLMDAVHMPTGCGTWPAWWQNGPNWPYGGEIDILEGVNAFTENQVSLHTGSGCTMPSNQNDLQLGTLTTGSFNSYDCASYDTSNQGCGVRDQTNDNSYGASFNNVGGGVYASECDVHAKRGIQWTRVLTAIVVLWGKVGIKVWWFPRSSIPADITNDVPDPSTWGTPVADFPSTSCSPYTFFYDHFNIFDTTLCGDWAGADGVWNYAGYAGQDQSCAAMTGYSTCSDYVLNSGSSFANAYWEVSGCSCSPYLPRLAIHNMHRAYVSRKSDRFMLTPRVGLVCQVLQLDHRGLNPPQCPRTLEPS